MLPHGPRERRHPRGARLPPRPFRRRRPPEARGEQSPAPSSTAWRQQPLDGGNGWE